jgi:hypothetical protein
MTDLSPQAQAVLDAFLKAPMGQSHVDDDLIAIAAALRAAAEQVVPFPGRYPMNEYMEGFREAKQSVHHQLLAIAAELEGDNEPTFTPEEVEMIQAPWSYLQSQQELEGGQ